MVYLSHHCHNIVMGFWGLLAPDTIICMGFRCHHFRQYHNLYTYPFNILLYNNKYTDFKITKQLPNQYFTPHDKIHLTDDYSEEAGSPPFSLVQNTQPHLPCSSRITQKVHISQSNTFCPLPLDCFHRGLRKMCLSTTELFAVARKRKGDLAFLPVRLRKRLSNSHITNRTQEI
jgi:hypothetical protein